MMDKRNSRAFPMVSHAMAALLLAASLLLAVGAQAAEEIEVGKREIGGMKVRVWLDEPMSMQMQMQGRWTTYRPKAGALTHHLGIDLTVSGNGSVIPTAGVEAKLTNRKTGKSMTRKLPAMLGKRFVYGANVRLDPGKYDLVVKITPPTIMRMGPSINKYQKSVQAKFELTVN
jgi:Fe2+ transport protein